MEGVGSRLGRDNKMIKKSGVSISVKAMSSCVVLHYTLQVYTKLKIREDFRKQARTKPLIIHCVGNRFLKFN